MEERKLGRMKKMMAVMTFLMILPAAAWAQEPSNTELYQMIKAMEQKFNEALDQTNQALAEAQKAKEEAAVAKQEAASAREEAARAKAELAQLKAAAAPAQPLIREAESVPGLGASLEVVYLRPSRSDLDYVIVDTNRTGNVRGSYKEVEPDYSAGARMGLSYDFGTGTAIRAQYLTLDTSDNSSAEKEVGVNDLWGTWLHANAIIDDNDVTSARMSYDFDLDVFDLSARKKLDMGSDLGLGIEAGLRYARIDQKIEVNYRQDVTSTANRRADIYNTNNFSGWGPRFGVDADWRMGKGFSLFGALAGSILLGDFDTSQLKAKINGYVAGWANHDVQFPAISTDFPQPKPGVYFIQKKINQGYISLGHLGIEETNPDYYAVQVMNFILGGGSFTSRITTKVRSNEGLSYNQGSRFTYHWGFPGTFTGYVQTKSSTVGYAISLIENEFNRIRTEPVTKEEMETAINYYLESFSSGFESPERTMGTFAEMEMTGQPLDYYRKYRDRISAVTKEKVLEVARKYIHPDRMVITIVGDWEPCNKGGDKWPGPLEKLGPVQRITLADPLTGTTPTE